MGTIQRGWTLALLVFCLLSTAAALSCASCDRARCPRVKELDCAGGGTVLDACGCCPVCARAEGDRCGGYFDALGRCAAGLVCKSRPQPGQLIGGAIEGICTREDGMSCQFCQLMLGRCVCSEIEDCDLPDVSDDPTSFTNRPDCEAAAARARLTTLSPTVGVAECPGVTCEESVSAETGCPADSVLKHTASAHAHCCPPVGACVCDLESCPPVGKCAPGEKVTLVEAGRRLPGHCCSVWQCHPAEDTAPSCTHEGRVYGAGDTWKADACTTCHCKDALTFCQPTRCAPLDGCTRVTHDKEQCCPRCLDGCISPSGVFHNSSERWLEDDCTTCSCSGDQLHCHTQMCLTTCDSPRHVPGRCCPVCDDTECTVACRHGYKTDERGDPLCECLSADDVARDPPQCRSMADCRRHCPHGFKRDQHGCEKCKCRRCRRLNNCSLTCPLEINERGCPICRCRLEYHTEVRPVIGGATAGLLDHIDVTTDAAPGGTTDRAMATTAGNACVSIDGSVHAEGASWHDGCRECYCHAGTEMCAFISCPVPACSHPEIRPGHCCPTCPDSPASRGGDHLTSGVCQSVDGATYLDGQSWSLDGCTRCLCQAGRVLCTAPQCPPAACARPQRHLHSCCAVCPPGGRAAGGRDCRTAAGVLRRSGEAWREGACRSCRCEDGSEKCYHETCAALDCEQPLLKKGQCCPQCIEPVRSSSDSCRYENRTLAAAETLVVDACTSCTCRAGGQLVCARKVCSPGCQQPVPVAGQCCPVCPEVPPSRRNYLYMNGTSKATHRVRVQQPDRTTQPARPGVSADSSGSAFTSPWQYVLCGVLALLLVLVLLTAGCCLYRHRRRNHYSPKPDSPDEKRPLNGTPTPPPPQSFDCRQLNNVAIVGGKPLPEKNGNISIIRDT